MSSQEVEIKTESLLLNNLFGTCNKCTIVNEKLEVDRIALVRKEEHINLWDNIELTNCCQSYLVCLM